MAEDHLVAAGAALAELVGVVGADLAEEIRAARVNQQRTAFRVKDRQTVT